MADDTSLTDARSTLHAIDKRLVELWREGSRFIAGWTLDNLELVVAVAPIARLPGLVESEPALLRGDPLDASTLMKTALRAGLETARIHAGAWWGTAAMKSALAQSIQRYGIRRSYFHAMGRIEIDGFMELPTAEKIAQLATLSYSINVAAHRIADLGTEIDLGRSPTAAGFRLWNRRQGYRSDIDLFCLIALALAENGLARGRDERSAPVVKAAFTVAAGWEFSLPRGGPSPVIHNDVLGEVRDMLTRLVDAALPRQILIGSFNRPMVEGPPQPGHIYRNLDAPRFMGLAQRRLQDFDNVLLGGEKVSSLKLYLTGDEIGPGTFDIKAFRYPINSAESMDAFNVKLNIHRPDQTPFFFGLQHRDLNDVAPTHAYYGDEAAREFILKD
ncbi:MAG: hypothetical protein GC202_10215 [Alphaproteobacteria bacterium]|nr:hypothetical protein [Alphaproteobacteria bacterium]